MSYINILICVGPLPYLETCPPIYRGQERTVRDKFRVSQSSPPRLLLIYTFEFIQRPTSPILSPSYWTFVEFSSASFQVSSLAADLVFLLQDDELKRGYLFWARIWAHRYLALIDFPCMSDLVLCDESAASSWPISIAVGSMLVPNFVRCHHAVPARWRN
jgi:hypothetical protein